MATTEIKCSAGLECAQNIGDFLRRRNTHQNVTVIRHNHETEEKEEMQMLNPVETFDCFPRPHGIGENWFAVEGHDGDERRAVILDPMALCHE